MTSETLLYIFIAGVIALFLAMYMYGFKTNYSKKARWIYGFLRFVTLFLVILLFLNPKINNEILTVEKPSLPVLIDNSNSIKELLQTEKTAAFVNYLNEHEELNNKFDINFYSFGSDINVLDSLSFTENNTNISQALTVTNELFKNEVAPTILITDGNQTLGSDYEFSSATIKNPVYPIILGDSIKYTDLKIGQLNTNRYAYLKNKFPVEVILIYGGSEEVNSQFVVKQGNTVVFREQVSFSDTENAKIISFTLPASAVGLQKYSAQIIPLSKEKNKTNNTKQFAIEVIDQATNVLIVSEIVHPDLGMLKRSITSNEQRRVSIMKPAEASGLLNDFQLVILYQPDRRFDKVYSEINKLNKNTLTITGLQTDWNYLNGIQENFKKEQTNQIDEIEVSLNPNYGAFAIEDIGFDDFKPLRTKFGDIAINVPFEMLLEKSVNGITTESVLLATTEINGKRDAILDGQGIWKWRAQSYLDRNSFEDFDNFFGKLIQYLASNKRRSRLEVTAETFYYNNDRIQISAQYFDKNYIFDSRSSLFIRATNSATKEQREFPLLLKSNYYEVDLSSLLAGEYDFSVTVKDEGISRSGVFTILDFNVEKQFLNANVTKLHNVATNTNGKAYFIKESESLLPALISDDRFQQIQKSEQKIVPLIDWRYLLGLIVLTLSIEWFIRKYNGLV